MPEQCWHAADDDLDPPVGRRVEFVACCRSCGMFLYGDGPCQNFRDVACEPA
jgi:hypothetical protein